MLTRPTSSKGELSIWLCQEGHLAACDVMHRRMVLLLIRLPRVLSAFSTSMASLCVRDMLNELFVLRASLTVDWFPRRRLASLPTAG
jgi:hypothetical protein